MKEMIRYGFTLAVICLVASGLLAGVNSLTKAKIISQAQAEEGVSLKEIIPQAAVFEPVRSGDRLLYYKALDKDSRLVAVAFKASAKGYSSPIETLVGMLPDGTILAIKVLSQNETPGLGTQVAGEEFTGQFRQKQNLADVQAITGATISSRAVIESVEVRAEEIKKLIKNGK